MPLTEIFAGYFVGRGLDRLIAWLPGKGKPVPHWEAAVAHAIPDMRIHGIVKEEPRVEVIGPVELSQAEIARADTIRPTLAVNDSHAMLVEEPILIHSPVRIRTQLLDFAELEAIRGTAKHRPIVTAGAVVVSPEERVLVFHHRARVSRTFPDCLHIIGGAYQPPTGAHGIDDHYSLQSAAQREVREEINAVITCDNDPPLLLAEEISEDSSSA